MKGHIGRIIIPNARTDESGRGSYMQGDEFTVIYHPTPLSQVDLPYCRQQALHTVILSPI